MGNDVKSRLKRLKADADACRARRIIVLCRTQDGTEKEMTVSECVEAKADFIQVLEGNDLKDVDALLNYMIGEICAID